MRWISAVCLCVLAAQLVSSYPVDDLQSKQETLSTLEASLGKPTSENSDRDKRTIGVLRRIFPELSKIIDDKIQQLTSVIFRIVGRFVLGGGGLGGGGGGGGGGGNSGTGDGGSRRISITLPTYPPDEDEDETEEPATTDPAPTEAPDSNDIAQTDGGSSRTKRETPEEPKPAESEKKEVRVVPDGNDLKAAASGDSQEAESSNEDDAEEAESGENTRSKRLGVLGNLFGGGSGSGSGGSGGGSGNFLFDIIRRTADGAARAAGTVYRVMAGTEDNDVLGNLADTTAAAAATSPLVTTPTTAKPAPRTLVAGSGATEQQDENANAPLAPGSDGSAGAAAGAAPSDDGYQAGIPGPITRLFVIANRGIANLIQDLILRLAQTSERIVNFKARLITAII